MARTHDLSQLNLSIGGVLVSALAFAGDGGLEFENGADVFSKKVGAGGAAVYNKLGDKTLDGTLTVMQSSAAYRQVAILQQAQERAPGAIAPMPFLMFDPITGTKVASQDCVFMTRPLPSMGVEDGDIEFKFSLPNPQITHAPLNTI